MTDIRCPVCGNKIGGMFGEDPASEEIINQAKEKGIYREGACYRCVAKAIREYMQSPEIDQGKGRLASLIPVLAPKIFLTPENIPVGFQDLGLVTGYCIIGTGPISTIASSLTDAFGMKSNAYLEKIRIAESDALNMLKLEALKKGGDAVYCCRVSLSEATSGHGMLMISVSGSAVNTNSQDKDILEARKKLIINEEKIDSLA